MPPAYRITQKIKISTRLVDSAGCSFTMIQGTPISTAIDAITNLNIHKYLAGHLGGEQQIGAQIEHNEIDLVIFLRDPLAPKAHEPDVSNVMRLCDMHNIPLATNLASAELLIKSLDRGDLEWREMYK